MSMYNSLKKLYNSFAAFVYKVTIKRKHIELAAFFETPKMSRYHHILCALRYVYIENYYGENDFGKQLYIDVNQWGSEQSMQYDIEKFDALIKSIEVNGYDSKSAIFADLDRNCINGTHRLALCAYFEIKNIPTKTLRRHLKRTKTIEEMKEFYKLSNDDFARLEAAYCRMRAKIFT